MKRDSILLTALGILFFIPLHSARAATVLPAFPSCLNPQGSVIASYDTGTHGIAGSSGTYTGSDVVYRINDTQVLQCFCAENNSGIQTNWIRAAGLSASDRKDMQASGWIFVPDGELWGLSHESYMARNLDYSCLPTGGGSSTGGGTGGAGDGLSDGRASCPECTAPPAIGGGDVLGLAATGGMWQVYAFFALSLMFLVFGIRKFLLR